MIYAFQLSSSCALYASCYKFLLFCFRKPATKSSCCRLAPMGENPRYETARLCLVCTVSGGRQTPWPASVAPFVRRGREAGGFRWFARAAFCAGFCLRCLSFIHRLRWTSFYPPVGLKGKFPIIEGDPLRDEAIQGLARTWESGSPDLDRPTLKEMGRRSGGSR
jgi:hypothetical protein